MRDLLLLATLPGLDLRLLRGVTSVLDGKDPDARHEEDRQPEALVARGPHGLVGPVLDPVMQDMGKASRHERRAGDESASRLA